MDVRDLSAGHSLIGPVQVLETGFGERGIS